MRFLTDRAVVSILPPTRLIGVNHRAVPDPFHNVGHHRLGLLGHPLGGGHDGPHAETQPVHRVQIPPDDAERRPAFFP